MKIKEKATIISQECLCDGVYSMRIMTRAARYACPGQFLSLYCNSDSRLLPRPISICEIEDGQVIRLVYRVAGAGTDEFSRMKKWDTIDIIGPNGNGFFAASGSVDETARALLIGGGIGIPPMVELAKQLKCSVTTVAGYRSNKDMFLTGELSEHSELVIATDDGSCGTAGTVIDAINENGITADIIFACGPHPMLRGVKELSEKMNIPAYISLEERMACGVGACLGCVCTTTGIDDHSKVNNARICADGPVFSASEVKL
ncbi:MAG: dihydroorotate dehydrogenase electron transfer subunit [Lachnospiraceae bacterium]|nr:dihydroorotate dehydrogenase electron transfer subunit [Lachnospiraceae bacterium]